MSKGENTKSVILETGLRMASRDGLVGVTIGRLADDLHLSKSGVFAHFQSKEALQEQILRYARDAFLEKVITPSLKKPRGEIRIKALFDNWLAWGKSDWLPGGCIFLAASSELDDKPGPVRDFLVDMQREWMATLAQTARHATQAGDFKADCDAEQFAYELYGFITAYHHASRLLGDSKAERRIKKAFADLLERNRRHAGANQRSEA